MLFDYKIHFFLSWLLAPLILIVGLSGHCAYAQVVTTANVSIFQISGHDANFNAFLATQSETYTTQKSWRNHELRTEDNLLVSGMALPSEQLQTALRYADLGLSDAENSQVPTVSDKISLIAYVPLPTTAWCFLIGLMTVLGMSKRRHSGPR